MADADAPAPCPDGHVDTTRLLSVFVVHRRRLAGALGWGLLRRGLRLRLT